MVQFHDDRNLIYWNIIVIVLILIYFMIMVHEDWISLITLLVLHRGFYVIHPSWALQLIYRWSFLCEIHQYEAATQNRRKTLCDPNKPDVYLTKGKLVNYIQACQTSWSIIRINIFRSINILYDSPLYEISYVHQTQTEPKRFGPNLVERIERLF